MYEFDQKKNHLSKIYAIGQTYPKTIEVIGVESFYYFDYNKKRFSCFPYEIKKFSTDICAISLIKSN